MSWLWGQVLKHLPEQTSRAIVYCIGIAFLAGPYYFVTNTVLDNRADEIILLSDKGDAFGEQRWIRSEIRATDKELFFYEGEALKAEEAGKKVPPRTRRRMRTLEDTLKQLRADDKAIQKKIEGKK